MQATNEELETLNEELQATVEELNTTNDDLQSRSIELQELALSLEDQRRSSETERARLQAVLASMSDAMVVVYSGSDADVDQRRIRPRVSARRDPARWAVASRWPTMPAHCAARRAVKRSGCALRSTA